MKRVLRAISIFLSLAIILTSLPPQAVLYAAETFSSEGVGSSAGELDAVRENPAATPPGEESSRLTHLDFPPSEAFPDLSGPTLEDARDIQATPSAETADEKDDLGKPQEPSSANPIQTQSQLEADSSAQTAPKKTGIHPLIAAAKKLLGNLKKFYDNAEEGPADSGEITSGTSPTLAQKISDGRSGSRRLGKAGDASQQAEGKDGDAAPPIPPPPGGPRGPNHDDFGGPQYESMGFRDRVFYGLRWGLSLQAAKFIALYSSDTLAKFTTWQTHLSSGLLEKFGRLMLLASYGPQKIAADMTQRPWGFLFLNLPGSVLWEEGLWRLAAFGGFAVALMGLRPASERLSKLLDDSQEFLGYKWLGTMAARAMAWASSHAFSIAAGLSAGGFALAHFKEWGRSPETILFQTLAGLGLSYACYKTKSMTAPIVAHFTYDLLGLIGMLIAVHFAMPTAAAAFMAAVGLLALGNAGLHFRSYRKVTAQQGLQPKAGGRLALAFLFSMALILNPIFGLLSLSYPNHALHRKATDLGVQISRDSGLVSDYEKIMRGQPAAPPLSQPKISQDQPKQWIESLTEQSLPSVVMIVTKMPQGLSIGTGFIIDQNGVVVTNGHVVGDIPAGGKILVELSSGKRLPAKVIAKNPQGERDIALIQLPANEKGKPWQALKIATSTHLQTGNKVLAFGHPLAYSFTATDGIISGIGDQDGLEMRGDIYKDMDQTSAPINHGNSGGPLVNEKGEVIGINSAGIDGANNVGFFIPSDVLLKTLRQFKKTGNINTAGLGIIIDTTNPNPPAAGVAIEAVVPGSPAAKAGLKAGDVIIGFSATSGDAGVLSAARQAAKLAADNADLTPTASSAAQQQAEILVGIVVGRSLPGDQVTLLVQRAKKPITVTVTLGNKSALGTSSDPSKTRIVDILKPKPTQK